MTRHSFYLASVALIVADLLVRMAWNGLLHKDMGEFGVGAIGAFFAAALWAMNMPSKGN